MKLNSKDSISELKKTCRVEKDQEWTLMCPNECPGLSDTYGKDFNKLYTSV